MRDETVIRGRKVLHSTLLRDWRCGVCESKLREVYDDDLGWVVVCAKNREHHRDSFITESTLAKRVHRELVQGYNLQQIEREGNMALKDRDAGGLPRRVRLTRIGKIRQGRMEYSEKAKRNVPVALPYFIIDPATQDEQERAEILGAVVAAIEEHAPPQDLNEPTVLPIRFMASSEEIISPEAYKKRRGNHGTVWCAGDGEYIQWKLDDQFKVEIAGGEPEVECPGGERDQKKRHPWCDECKPEVELNFSIWGYERTGTWVLRTTSMSFRDQFRTVMRMVEPMIEAGIISGISHVPFLLRRKEEEVLAPKKDGSLMSTSMPITSIEIKPEWFQEQMRRQRRTELAAPEHVAMIESGDEVEAEAINILPGELPGCPYDEVDDWDGDAPFWDELIRQATKRLGYKNEEDVKNALRALFGDVSGAQGYQTRDIWQLLREHKAVPATEGAPF